MIKVRKQPANKGKTSQSALGVTMPSLDDDKEKFDRSGFSRRMKDGRVVQVAPTRAKRPGK